MLSKPLMVALGPAGRRQLVAVSRRNMGTESILLQYLKQFLRHESFSVLDF